jgi:hypothetical protein
MTINEENKRWAAGKLSRFSEWLGFPKTPEGIDAYARSLLRLVHNKTVREILAESGVTKFDRCSLPLDANDADWLLDLVYDSFEEFPMPIALRRVYTDRLPPATSIHGID